MVGAVVYEISKLMNTGLDREQLSILVSMCENGVNPEALGVVVKELRREAAAFKVIGCPAPESADDAGAVRPPLSLQHERARLVGVSSGALLPARSMAQW